MGLFKSSKNKVVINNSTVIRNGKVVSSDDPYVKEELEKMQKKFGKYLGNDYMEKMMQGTEDVTDSEELQEDLTDLADMEGFENFAGAFFSSEQPAQTKIVECKNCGANNTITLRKNAICEYCGTGLEY